MNDTEQFGSLQTHIGRVDPTGGLARRPAFITAKVEKLIPEMHAVSIRYTEGGIEVVPVIGSEYNLPAIGDWVVVGFAHGFNKPLVFGKLMLDNDPLIVTSDGDAIHGKKEIHDSTYENVLSMLEWKYDNDGNLTIRLKQNVAANGSLNIIVEGKDATEGSISLDMSGPFMLTQRDVDGNIVQSIILNNLAGQEGFTVLDAKENKFETGKEGIRVSTPLQQDQHSVFGEVLVQKIDKLINAIKDLTVGTSQGKSTPPLNQADFIAVHNELSDILTKVS